VAVAIWVLTAAAVLLQIDAFRQFGAGLLASAGIASVVLGFAAQSTLGNLIAGFQIALAQPIRLDDVVVIEGEWGRIEEITLTYVVVHIWDERRLMLPISWFLHNPFTNWTRRASDLLGSVYLYVDFTAPLPELREKLIELVTGNPDWDGRVAEIVVTDSTATNMQLRALVSTRDSGAGWRLRCHVREGLLTFLQREHPFSLPRAREQHVHPPGSAPHP
jgi:small-conductance mechanosensitive channel